MIFVRSGYCQGVSASGVKVVMMAAVSLLRMWSAEGAISMSAVWSAE